MQINADTPEDYIRQLPQERQKVMQKLRDVINQNIPQGFLECMNYGMIGYVVPLSTYPDGYRCDPQLPLPFLNIASQKNHIAVYHMGIYADKELLNWFQNEYPKHSSRKLDMGKSCIRFGNIKEIPYKLMGELVSRITPEQWIEIYSSSLKK